MARTAVQRSVRTFILIGCEAALILGAVMAAAWIRLGPEARDVMLEEWGLFKALAITVTCQFCFYYSDLYDLRVVGDHRELFVRTVRALGVTSLILALVYYWFPALVLGRGVFMIAAALVVILTVGWRVAFVWGTLLARPVERILLVGTNPAAVEFARELHDRRAGLGVVIVGFVDTEPPRAGDAAGDPPVLGAVDDIPTLVKAHNVDRVVVSLTDARGKLPMEKLLDMRMAGVSFAQLPSVYEEYTGKIAVENLRPSWLVFSDGFAKVTPFGGVMRIVDITGSVVLLLLALPVMAVTAAAVRLTSPGPAFYVQRRVGMSGRVFNVYKFRSMRNDAEAESGAVWATPGEDPRVTPVGRFLRRSRLDELPQLWNVLRGDMSLVGPRPERPEFVENLTRQIPFYGQRHVIRPGLTGWAQVRYAYGASVEDSMEKLQYDLYYIKNRSMALNLYIIFETLKTVITRSGS
jgi:sugar transferase (PEP-CTERM system associated)